MAWACPGCRTAVRYKDYDRLMRAPTRACPDCGLELAIDKRTDQLIPVVPTTYSPTQRKPTAATTNHGAQNERRRRASDDKRSLAKP